MAKRKFDILKFDILFFESDHLHFEEIIFKITKNNDLYLECVYKNVCFFYS